VIGDGVAADNVDLVAALGKETSPPMRVEITRIGEEANLHRLDPVSEPERARLAARARVLTVGE
jgi:hypothetical protein